MNDDDNLAAGMATQLAAIMTRYRQHQAEPRERGKGGAVVSAADIRDAVLKSRWETALDEVQRDAVRFALRASAREIGWHAHAVGGLEFMHRVSDLMEKAGGSGATLDKWWDGIGDPKGTWIA